MEFDELVKKAQQNVKDGIELAPNPNHDKDEAFESVLTAMFSGQLEEWLETVQKQHKQ